MLEPRRAVAVLERTRNRPLRVALDGSTLRAVTHAGGADADGREALLKYVLRPPIAQERVTRGPDGLVGIALKATEAPHIHTSIRDLRERAMGRPDRFGTIVLGPTTSGRAAEDSRRVTRSLGGPFSTPPGGECAI